VSWADLIWFPPIMLGVAMVLGSASAGTPKELPRSILSAFFTLTFGVVGVAAVIHFVAYFFSG